MGLFGCTLGGGNSLNHCRCSPRVSFMRIFVAAHSLLSGDSTRLMGCVDSPSRPLTAGWKQVRPKSGEAACRTYSRNEPTSFFSPRKFIMNFGGKVHYAGRKCNRFLKVEVAKKSAVRALPFS